MAVSRTELEEPRLSDLPGTASHEDASVTSAPFFLLIAFALTSFLSAVFADGGKSEAEVPLVLMFSSYLQSPCKLTEDRVYLGQIHIDGRDGCIRVEG